MNKSISYTTKKSDFRIPRSNDHLPVGVASLNNGLGPWIFNTIDGSEILLTSWRISHGFIGVQFVYRWFFANFSEASTYTLLEINISHLGKRKIIFKMPFLGDMLVSWRVTTSQPHPSVATFQRSRNTLELSIKSSIWGVSRRLPPEDFFCKP